MTGIVCSAAPQSELNKAPWTVLDRSVKMAGAPVGTPHAPARLQFMRGKPPLMRLDHITASLVGLMRVRRHSHRHA